MKPSITFFLDSRREKLNGKYPIKLNVFASKPQRLRKLYPIGFDMSEIEFNETWKSKKPKREFQHLRIQLDAILSKANEVASNLDPFTLESFEKKFLRQSGEGILLNYQYDQIIKELNSRNQIGNASNYDLSRKSLISFLAEKYPKKNFKRLTFHEINANWLKDYEFFMVNEKKRSHTTVSFYLRALRTIFNRAIEEGEIEKELYPFGKRKYQVPATKKVKKALSQTELQILFNAAPQNKEQEKAKDFWFFSYGCNGMNIKDIAQLQFKDIKEGKIEFFRAKTITTSKGSLKPIEVYLNDFSKSIIEKYGNESKNPDNYVFEIINNNQSPQEQRTKIQNFTRFVNQHIKKLCGLNDISTDISTYWARHSFATVSIRKGASLEFIQESLGHENLKTTQGYFAGFDQDNKKEFAKSIMDFNN
jgi:integrase/recombinase XerD